MRAQSWWLRFAGVAGVIVAVLLAVDVWPLLRGPAEWRWALGSVPPTAGVAATPVAALLFLGGWWWLGTKATTHPGRALLLLGLLTLGLQAALLSTERTNPAAILFERLASDQASGYFTVASSIEHLPTFLREFPERLPLFTPDPHPRSKPPGIILVYWATEQLMAAWPAAAKVVGYWGRGVRCGDLALATRPDAALAANTLVALLTPIMSTLALWPAFYFVRRRRGGAAGWLAAGVIALMPGRLLFTPHMDTVYPALTLLALLAVDTGLRRRRWGWTAVGGLLVGIATFLSLVNGLTGVLLALFITFTRRPEREGRQWLQHGAALAAGAAGPWVLYWLTSRVTPWAIYVAAAPARHDLARDYWTWLPGNLVDFAFFAGLPAFLLALSYLARRRSGALAHAFWLLLIGLLLSGAIRGEVGRIWLMLAPLPALLAVNGKDGGDRRGSLIVLIGTVALTAVMGLRWEVTQLEWPPPIERVVVRQAPDGLSEEAVSFGADISLLSATVSERDPLAITTVWRAWRRPSVPYTVFVHLIDADGRIAAQTDQMPAEGQVPTTCWQANELFVDTITVDSAQLPSGVYSVTVGLYDGRDGSRPSEPVLVEIWERP